MSNNPYAGNEGNPEANPFGTPPMQPGTSREQALAKVKMPALLLLITGILSIIGSILYAFFPMALTAMLDAFAADPDMPADALEQLEQAKAQVSGPLMYVQVVVGLIGGCLMSLGAIKMKNLQSYGLAMTGCIVAMVPYLSVCCTCVFPIGIGIWGIVVLVDQGVKQNFS